MLQVQTKNTTDVWGKGNESHSCYDYVKNKHKTGNPPAQYIHLMGCVEAIKHLSFSHRGVSGTKLLLQAKICSSQTRIKSQRTQCVDDKHKILSNVRTDDTENGSKCKALVPKNECKVASPGRHTGANLVLVEQNWKNEEEGNKHTLRDKQLSKRNSFLPPIQLNEVVLKDPFARTSDLGARVNSRRCSVSSVYLSRQNTNMYRDPVFGAPSWFLQRLLEISTLQEETMRHENTKKLQNSKKVDL